MDNVLTSKFVGGLFSENECTRCMEKRFIDFIWQDSYGRVVANFCKGCSAFKSLKDGEVVKTPEGTVLV